MGIVHRQLQVFGVGSHGWDGWEQGPVNRLEEDAHEGQGQQEQGIGRAHAVRHVHCRTGRGKVRDTGRAKARAVEHG